MLNIVQNLTKYNFSDRPPGGREIKYIVIHYFGVLGTAEAVADFYAGAYYGASAHYALDEGPDVYQMVLDEDVSWHCGTTGTYYHPDCRNSNSIGIEVRPRKLDHSTVTRADAKDWYFDDQIVDNLVELVKGLMAKYDIPPERVVRHYDVTHKWCPRPWMGDDINTYYNETGNSQWAKFLARLTENDDKEDEDMVRFNTLAEVEKGASWALPTIQKLVARGVIRGGGKQDADGNPADMDLSMDMLRLLVMLDRAGAFGE